MTKTNFEKIKEMSIEQMARWLCRVLNCDSCPITDDCHDWTKCVEKLSKWLEASVRNDRTNNN